MKKYYVYRFLDKYKNIIYVGYTSQLLSTRMDQHFTKGHLPKECYDSVAEIQYKAFANNCDAMMLEIYYINLYKPKYNKKSLCNQQPNYLAGMEDDNKWHTYKRFMSFEDPPKAEYAYWFVGLLGAGILLAVFL